MLRMKLANLLSKPIRDKMNMVVTVREVCAMYPSLNRMVVYRKLDQCTYRRDFENGTCMVWLPSVLKVFGTPEVNIWETK